jgi:hypothetical protein
VRDLVKINEGIAPVDRYASAGRDDGTAFPLGDVDGGCSPLYDVDNLRVLDALAARRRSVTHAVMC